MDKSRIPVLVGAGQITQREPDPVKARSPIDLTAAAVKAAAVDAGAGARLIGALDTVVVVRAFADTSWRFASPFGGPGNPPHALAGRIGAHGVRRHVYTWPGGNMPQWCLNRICEAITRGEIGAAVIAGGEALATQKAAVRAGIALDWRETCATKPEHWGVATRGWNDVEERHRMAGAIFAYPLFENAIRGARGRTIAEHQQSMGRLFARFAGVAAENPRADRRQGYTAEEIATVSSDNPYIGFPYTRLMNANAFIDQSAAVIVTSLAKAEALGIPRDRHVYLVGCADAHDHWYISNRKTFHTSPAMRLVAERALEMASLTRDDIAHFDIYSCFPSAVEVACAEMGLAEDDPRGLTVTGGLAYFGGPGNNYVTHAIAEMMQRLRAHPGARGLVTANGNYLTKQSAGILTTTPPDEPFAPADPSAIQAAIDANPGPPTTERPEGAAAVETYTVMHERGRPAYAIVFARLADGTRFIANTPDDSRLLADMTERDYLGAGGRVALGDDGRAIFTPD